MIDKCMEIYEIHENIFLNKDLLFMGHRKGEYNKFNNNLWTDSYYDEKDDIFVGIPKKINIEELIKLEQENYISSYIFVFHKLEILNLENLYNKRIKPSTDGILGLIMKYKLEELKKYEIIAMFMMGDNEEWIRYIEI
jgi:hypothetical protein